MSSNPNFPQPAGAIKPGDLIDERKAAASLGIAIRTLRNWRALRKGPCYRKIGARLVRYHVADLAEFQRVMNGEAA